MHTIGISNGAVHKVPPDLKAALHSSPAAKAAWEDITPLARNEWICWVVSVKKPETRRQHVERVRTELQEGKRRPCCWVGCMHRGKLNRTQKWLNQKQKQPKTASRNS